MSQPSNRKQKRLDAKNKRDRIRRIQRGKAFAAASTASHDTTLMLFALLRSAGGQMVISDAAMTEVRSIPFMLRTKPTEDGTGWVVSIEEREPVGVAS